MPARFADGYQEDRIQALVDAGLATPAKRSLRDLPLPLPRRRGQRPLTEAGPGLEGFVTYDGRLAEAAQDLGVSVVSPR